jgi:hypothetical protein
MEHEIHHLPLSSTDVNNVQKFTFSQCRGKKIYYIPMSSPVCSPVLYILTPKWYAENKGQLYICIEIWFKHLYLLCLSSSLDWGLDNQFLLLFFSNEEHSTICVSHSGDVTLDFCSMFWVSNCAIQLGFLTSWMWCMHGPRVVSVPYWAASPFCW